ncbi:MAG TPA: hypothetical protein DCQ26_13660 [Marinilabiliales bacterium]|nr:MAG: hypothetical protein A2W84_14970 [Bacteroidetes bacterium GWC2_40_13]OFX71446.1 MAG: hypothetical protein A2W96_13075 [Bacteroidetes bacterium GWD2_40_43]OFX92695.1 MAG: hypothetical protein A2W97_08820 [Bacteroidetes bacterium GWE2_40_63]OFY17600.1 MAG: hypothetical protein A2W88_10900 [Bacteroidetes bacterium GWF2_40_13]OFZ28053.1 MAG: hypothetical protein A2437_04075 [Bacteroidetes bacterium RIFOXYC2_FULL_40_12]HAM99649.1 hypothetical protein [Marinilabiliales bacterium]
MEKALHIFFVFGLLFFFNHLQAQFGVEEYHQEDGLPTDLVKAFAIDGQGFLWIATDGGVVRHEGKDFIPIENIEQSSNYYKNLLQSKKFGFIAASDDGLITISEDNGRYFGEFTQSALNLEYWRDDNYSKSLFEASDSSLWIANNTSIFHLTQDTIISVLLPKDCHTTHYVRNHQVLELNNIIYVVCHLGTIFRLEPGSNSLIVEPWVFQGAEVFSSAKIDEHNMLIGNGNGLIKINLSGDGKINEVFDLEFPYPVSTIEYHDGNYYLGTWSQGLFTAMILENKLSYTHIEATGQQTINDICFDNQNQTWLATNFGILLLRNRIFNSRFTDVTENYIQDFFFDGGNCLYYSDGWQVDRINLQENSVERVYRITNDLILQILKKDKDLWMSTYNGKIQVLKPDKSIRTLDFSSKGKEILNLVEDKNHAIWFLQNRARPTLVRINPDGSSKEFNFLQYPEQYFITLEIDPQGELYVGGHGFDSYLFRFDYSNDTFINLSKPINGLRKKIFEINDMAFSKSGKLVLGTSEGIWEYTTEALSRIDLYQMNIENVPSVTFDNHERLWFVNSSGLNLFDGEQFTVFNNFDGLPSTTNSPRNLLIDSYNTLWMGTNLGLASGKILYENRPSPMPKLRYIENSTRTYMPNQVSRFLEKTQLKIAFTAPLYPSKFTVYQYSLAIGGKEEWIDIKKNQEELVFDQLTHGPYTLKIRAKGKGFYQWSEPLIYRFEIYKTWYTQFWVISLFYFGILAIIVLFISLSRKKSDLEKRKLEAIIELRTKALQDQNEELKQLNISLQLAKDNADTAIRAKDRFFSIVAHDLKSPFNTLIGFSELLVNNRDQIPEESMQEFFEEMLRTSENTYKLLQNLLDWARSQTGNLVVECKSFKVEDALKEVLDTITPAAKQKNIQIVLEQQNGIELWADVSLISTSLRNILSNAVKFSYADSQIELNVKSLDQDWVEITVCDFGVGIDEERLPYLFNIEKNVSTLGTASEKGTGLGLILCKEFIERCHGTLVVDSQIGTGTLFTIKLPSHAII